MKSFFTSETVTCGHPDKVCDQIADAILDAILTEDPMARVACEVAACVNKVHIMGEISSSFNPDYERIARQVIANIGYTKSHTGFDSRHCRVRVDVHKQSPDIDRGVSRSDTENSGAGDQGILFGYACRETESLMPLPITLANSLALRLETVRRENIIPDLLPDGKTQVTVEYRDGCPKRIATVLVSAQHRDTVDTDALRSSVIQNVILAALPSALLDEDTAYFVNPTGRFVIGGPAGDAGLTGKKLIADTYGGMARHGGGSFSGKDATKVDKSGAYMARYLAKNIVASGLADLCEVSLAYAIGLADPVSLWVNTFGTGKVPDESLTNWVTSKVDTRPTAIIERFGLRRPMYRALSCHGHFGENASEMPWEKTDLAASLAHDLYKS